MEQNSTRKAEQFKPHDPTWEASSCSWDPDGPFEGFPDLRFFQYAELRKAKTLFEHQHANAFEFMYIEKGKASWEVNGTNYETRSDDVFCTLPNELHRASYDIIEPCSLWSIIIEIPQLSELRPDEAFTAAATVTATSTTVASTVTFDAASDNASSAKALCANENPLSRRSWLQMQSDEIEDLLAGLYCLPRVISVKFTARDILKRLAYCIEKKEPYYKQDGKLALMDFLLLLLRSKPVLENVEDSIVWKIQKLAEEMQNKPFWRPSVPELAVSVGVSTSYFYNVFQEHTRLSPLVYMERLRIKEACRRLKETAVPVTELSLDLGYATSQHFATAFKRVTGKSPSQWRAS